MSWSVRWGNWHSLKREGEYDNGDGRFGGVVFGCIVRSVGGYGVSNLSSDSG